MQMCGGFTPDSKEPEERHQFLANSVRAAVETKQNTKFEMFELVSYHSQVVAGTNYAMKIQVSEAVDGFIHIKVFEPLPHTGNPAVLHPDSNIVVGKTREEAIIF